MTNEQARDCYYVLRAMHDGACPKCGYTNVPEMFVKGDTLFCPNCAFYLEADVIRAIQSLVPEIMARRVDNLLEVYGALKEMKK